MWKICINFSVDQVKWVLLKRKIQRTGKQIAQFHKNGCLRSVCVFFWCWWRYSNHACELLPFVTTITSTRHPVNQNNKSSHHHATSLVIFLFFLLSAYPYILLFNIALADSWRVASHCKKNNTFIKHTTQQNTIWEQHQVMRMMSLELKTLMMTTISSKCNIVPEFGWVRVWIAFLLAHFDDGKR